MEAVTGHVLVLGLGRSGRAAAEYLAGLGRRGEPVTVTVLDQAEESRVRSAAARLREMGAEVVTGTSEPPPGRYDLVVASPGIAPGSALMTVVRSLGAPIVSEIELAWRISRSPWVAVTGTNGKTTTTALIAHLLVEAGVPAVAVGNIGQPAVTEASQAGPATVLVAEISSFQLASTERLCPRVAVLLNITPDHIDWHGSMEAYTADKARLFDNQGPSDLAVIDVDDIGSEPWADTVERRGVPVCRVSRRGLRPGGAGLVDGVLTLDTPEGPVGVLPAAELPIRGDHNVSNALAACAAAVAAGAPVRDLAAGLRSFSPVEHRLEPAGCAGGVEYYNDSKATNPDAVMKALTAFDDRPIVVLLGGRNKGNDFGPLAAAVAARCRAAVLFGEAMPELAEALGGATDPGIELDRCVTMASAVAAARTVAQPGDVVLLSPGCASFDEFADYEHRGRAFRAMVDTFAGEDPGGCP
jgi:UDP-N-acetylmuramoylalanine--D-glutamate ligase